MVFAQFTDTITLGAAILTGVVALATLVGIIAGVRYRGVNKIQEKHIEAQNLRISDFQHEIERRDTRLNNLGAEKDEALQDRAAAIARAEELERQMTTLPRYDDVVELVNTSHVRVVELMTEGLKHVDEEAAKRQAAIVERMGVVFDRHEDRAEQRHHSQMEATANVVEALGGIANRIVGRNRDSRRDE